MRKYTKLEIENKLDEIGYKYKIYPTYLEQEAIRWKRGMRRKFEESLANIGLKNFAYIKFYINHKKEKIGLVAGKSGSIKVNLRSDLNFSVDPKDGESRIFLNDNNFEWDQTEILVIGAEADDKIENRRQAFKIESMLKDLFNLNGK